MTIAHQRFQVPHPVRALHDVQLRPHGIGMFVYQQTQEIRAARHDERHYRRLSQCVFVLIQRAAGTDHIKMLDQQFDRDDIIAHRGVMHDRQTDFALCQLPFQCVREAFDEAQFDVRVIAFDPRQQRGDDEFAGRGRHPHHDHPARRIGMGGHIVMRLCDLRHDRIGPALKDLPRFGQFHAPRRAVKDL